MKAEINWGNRVRFEANYILQDVYRDVRGQTSESGILTPRLLARPESKYDWLELKSLEKISDEDVYFKGLNPKYYGEDGWWDKHGDFYVWNHFDIDYLRSKGYALPWMGLSVEEMVEAGWIKLTE